MWFARNVYYFTDREFYSRKKKSYCMKIQANHILFLFRGFRLLRRQKLKKIQAGNDFYKQQQFDQAASEYSKALKLIPPIELQNSILPIRCINRKKQDEAVKVFTEVAVIQRNGTKIKSIL